MIDPFKRRPRGPAPVALAVADLHFWAKPPLVRTAEPDWLGTMQRSVDQLKALQAELSGEGPPLPILCAGDVFDRYNPSPELLNWCLDHLPHMVSVCGQHDLPHHRYEVIERSGYWTLVKACRITHCPPGKPVGVGKVRVTGFNWGFPLVPNREPHGLALEVALCHHYVWSKNAGTGYPGAPEANQWVKSVKHLKGFDVAVFGDNHKPLLVQKSEDRPAVFNPGTFLRRKLDEIPHRPAVGIVHEDGSVKRHYLDCSGDKFLLAEAAGDLAQGVGLQSFIEGLTELGDCALDFGEQVKRLMERGEFPTSVKELVSKLLEGARQ